MPSSTLITGGARSGKSAHAMALAAGAGRGRRAFIATAQALDDEMAARIEHHRAVRPGDFETVEEPLALTAALAALDGNAEVVVLDCLTLWISNLMALGMSDEAILAEADGLADALRQVRFTSYIVTDEVGAGIVPDHPAARRFRDLLGWTNQKIGRVVDEIVLMACGYPVRIK